ncbi:MAG TPA: hypothetical protein VEA63_04310, partial [Opitutus sp.]|nr:hypothetical protein [Opitutus sp.]
MIRRLLAFLALATCAFAANNPEATSIVAGHSETNIRTGETILTDNPRVDYGDVRLTADEITINPSTHIAVARGNATLTRGERRLLSDYIAYNSADGTFEVGDLRVGQYPVYASGSRATGTVDSLTVENARVTVP